MPGVRIQAGERHGSLMVLYGISGLGRRRVVVQCDCGSVHSIVASSLRQTNECQQCYWARVEKHGHTSSGVVSPTYHSWKSMRERCRDPNKESYRWYGAKGIKVCERWDSFDAFLADMGERPSRSMVIDRIDASKDYEPGNCRWLDARENVSRAKRKECH